MNTTHPPQPHSPAIQVQDAVKTFRTRSETVRAVQGFQRCFTRGTAWPIALFNGTANWILHRFGLEPQLQRLVVDAAAVHRHLDQARDRQGVHRHVGAEPGGEQRLDLCTSVRRRLNGEFPWLFLGVHAVILHQRPEWVAMSQASRER